MINAIAQLATVNVRIGRIFNQSETENAVNKTSMHDTRTIIDTRHCRANKSHIDSNYNSLQLLENESDPNYFSLQPSKHETTVNHSRMNNNSDENQNTRQFRNDRQIRYHWGADDEIMAIFNSREKSPETTELVRRRTDLARPGALRSQWNKRLGREIYVPRRPEEDEREIKRIDIQLKRKQEQSRIGSGYFREFGDEIPQGPENEEQEHNNENEDTESITSSNTEEALTKHEPGAYPAKPVQENRDGPIEDIAVHYVRINRVVEQKATKNKLQEDNIRAAELDFMLDLETVNKETATDPELIEVNFCLEENNSHHFLHDYKTVAKKLTHRWGIVMVDDRIIIPKTLRYAALNALHFGHPRSNKMCSDAGIFWWTNMRTDIVKKAKTCSACLNAGKILKIQLPSTEKTKIESPKKPGEEIQIDYTGNLHNRKLQSSLHILVAVDKTSR